jgi:hypothetical protein
MQEANLKRFHADVDPDPSSSKTKYGTEMVRNYILHKRNEFHWYPIVKQQSRYESVSSTDHNELCRSLGRLPPGMALYSGLSSEGLSEIQKIYETPPQKIRI